MDALKLDLQKVTPITDPTTGSGDVFLFPEALGQDGRPYAFLVEDPPHKTRARHHHHADVLYVYVKGEHHIEGEGTYRAGDVRWTRAGHTYGPETTGPEGGAWWVLSYGDPIPVEAEAGPRPDGAAAAPGGTDLPRFSAPYDWPAIDAAVLEAGGVILEGLLGADEVARLNRQIDGGHGAPDGGAGPASGSDAYDLFLGNRTLRLHGLVEKFSETVPVIGREPVVEWARRMMGPAASSVLLNAGELIQIQPGEEAQFPHRDTDSWPALAIGPHPVLVNVIYALDDFTLENGATYVAPGSWRWPAGRRPRSEEYARAVMARGDALLFRGDLVHGGGENRSSGRRRALSVSYCAGWLRPVENSFLNVPRDTARHLPATVRALLGYEAHDATHQSGGLVGLFEGGDPARALETSSG